MIPEYNLTNSMSYLVTAGINYLAMLTLVSSVVWICLKYKQTRGKKSR